MKKFIIFALLLFALLTLPSVAAYTEITGSFNLTENTDYNISFTQEPYFTSAFITLNQSALIQNFTDEGVSEVATSVVASNLANGYDEDFATYAQLTANIGASETRSITYEFNYSGRYEQTTSKAAFFFTSGGSGATITEYCKNATGWQQMYHVEFQFIDYSDFPITLNIPSSCIQGPFQTKIELIMPPNVGGGGNILRYYEHAAYVNRTVLHEADDYVFLNSSTAQYAQTLNITDMLNNASEDNLLTLSLTNALKANVSYNYTFDYLYNATVNVTPLSSLDNSTINASCQMNGITYFPSFETIYFNSSLQNTLVCSFIGYANTSYQVDPTVSATYLLMPGNYLNVSFFDEESKALINDRTIMFELFGDSYTYNDTTTNGTLALSLFTPGTYTFRFDAPGYIERFWQYELSESSSSSLSLYLLSSNSSSNMTIQVFDEFGNPVKDAQVLLYRYDLATNSYPLTTQQTTDFEGKVRMDKDEDEFYRIAITYDGEVKKFTAGAYLLDSYYEFTISIFGTVLEGYFNLNDIVYTPISFNNDTKNFRFFYNDVNNYLNSVCLKAYMLSANYETLISESCSSATSSLLLTNIPDTQGVLYEARAYFYFPNQTILRDVYQREQEVTITFGVFGLFLVLMLVIVFSFAFRSVEIAIAGHGLPLILGSVMGLLDNIPLAIATGYVTIMVVLALLVGFRRFR